MENKKASSQCEECTRECEQSRPNGCEHECSIGACHPGKCPDCIKLLKFKCHCNTNFVYVECGKWLSANKPEKEALKSCQVPCPKSVIERFKSFY
jgi:NF-X1-type zinc finger protein NFXL1